MGIGRQLPIAKRQLLNSYERHCKKILRHRPESRAGALRIELERLLLDQELLRSRSIAILDIDIRPLAVHAVGVFLDLHALVRVDYRADCFRHAVVDPFLGVSAVAGVQLDVVAVVGIALVQVNAQVLVIAHLDGQAVEIPLFGCVGIVLRPELNVRARFSARVRMHRKIGRQDRDDVFHV